jgi:inner membrane protein
MRGVPHALIGASVGVVLAGGAGREAWPVVAIAAGSALLRDLDVPTSTASGLFRGVTGFAGLALGVGSSAMALDRTQDPAIALLIGVACWLGVLVATSRLQPWLYFEHRGPFHSIAVALLVGLVVDVAVGRVDITLAVLGGWLSHLLADGPTYMGQPLLWPVSRQLLHLAPRGLRFRSGSLLEWPIAIACLALSLCAAAATQTQGVISR